MGRAVPCRSDFDNDYDVFLCFNNEGNFLHWPHPGRGARRYLWTNSKSAVQLHRHGPSAVQSLSATAALRRIHRAEPR